MRIQEFNTGDVQKARSILDGIFADLSPDHTQKARQLALQQLGFGIGHAADVHVMQNGIPNIKRLTEPNSKIISDGGYISQSEAEMYLADALYAAQETIKSWIFLKDEQLTDKEVVSPDGSLLIKIQGDDLVVTRMSDPETDISHGPTFKVEKDKVLEYETFADTCVLRRNHRNDVFAPLGIYVVTGYNDAEYNSHVKYEMSRDEFLAKYAKAMDQRDKPTNLQATYFIAQQQAGTINTYQQKRMPDASMIINYLPTKGDKEEAISMICPDKYKAFLTEQNLRLTTLQNKPVQWKDIGGPDDPAGERFKQEVNRLYDTYAKLVNTTIENIHSVMTKNIASPEVIRRQMSAKERMPSDTVPILHSDNPNIIDFASKVKFSDGEKTIAMRVDFERKTVTPYIDGKYVPSKELSVRADNVRLAIKDALMGKKDFSKNTIVEAIVFENKERNKSLHH